MTEEEIAELKEDLRNKKLAIQNRKGRIKELEEENAELKEKENTVHTLDVLHKEAWKEIVLPKESE